MKSATARSCGLEDLLTFSFLRPGFSLPVRGKSVKRRPTIRRPTEATAQVSKLTVIAGVSHGAASYGMASALHRISVMGGDQAAETLLMVKRDQLAARGRDDEQRRAGKGFLYKDKDARRPTASRSSSSGEATPARVRC